MTKWILTAALFLASCSSPKKLIVGSRIGTEDMLVGEIAAQHLERRLQTQVDRRLGIGDTVITHSSLTSGQIDLYPQSTGIISTVVLRETPSTDAAVLLERTRAEMARLAQAEFIGPLGYASPSVAIVAVADAEKLETLSDAAKGKTEWKIGVTTEFQQRASGLTAFNSYRIPMADSVRTTNTAQLFSALEKRDLTMVIATATDGHLTSPKWKVLSDDQNVFPPEQAVLLVRTELLSRDPRVRAALTELVGKLPSGVMRRLNSEVDIEKKPIATVAADFLASAGLK